jgi:pyruvate formate lyase activating enzyme
VAGKRGSAAAIDDTAVVFDVQKFAVHDGPGIRTLVFFKGCPLRCAWCSNPESHVVDTQVVFFPSRCIACLKCVEACSKGAISTGGDGLPSTDRTICDDCGECTGVCYADARVVLGRKVTLDELMAEIRQDAPFYRRSGGGVTLGGGEVLVWAPFAERILKACIADGINTAVETCGYGEWASLEALIPYVGLFYYDVKLWDPVAHERLTGSSNELILANLERLAKAKARIIVRVPIIPGLNDDCENVRRIAEHVVRGKLAEKIELLPYHRLGKDKYVRLGVAYELQDILPPTQEDMSALALVVEAAGISCQIGG